MRKKWFGPKKFGYGYAPVSWEGWTVVLLIASACMLVGIFYP